MNARELAAVFREGMRGVKSELYPEQYPIILRALDLLAGVEESGDELVRGLRDYADWQLDCGEEYRVILRAAARIVALEAENARLRGHSEAMAYISEEYWNRSANSRAMLDALDRLDAAAVAYRADFPKEKA